MRLYLCIRTHRGNGGEHLRLDGLPEQHAGPVKAQTLIQVSSGTPPAVLLCVSVEPAADRLELMAGHGSRHYFRYADATLRPLPHYAAVSLSPGDAYVALSPAAGFMADPTAIAGFLHTYDHFNAERLAQAVLSFLLQESGPGEFPLDVMVIVVEAR